MIYDKLLLDKISEITNTDYEIYDDYVPADTSHNMITDLLDIINHLTDEIDDIKLDLAENYVEKKVNPYEEYGISESDFYE